MNEQYLNQTIRRIVYLESLKQSEINNLSAHLKEIDDLIKSLMLDEEMTDLTVAEFNKVLTAVKTGVATSLSGYTVAVGASLTAIAIDTYQFEVKSLNNAFDDVKLSTKIDDKKQAKIAKLVSNTPLSVTGSEGKTVTDLFNELANNESNKYINHIKLARYEGKTNQQIVQMIRGTRKNGYKDGLMEVTSRQAKTIVRTTVQHAAMQGKAEFANDNADIIKGEQWLSTMDFRTSSQCRSLDLQIFELGKGPRPPLHHNCRSTILIVLKDEYAGRGNINKRASKDGPVANESYYSWLNKQPKEFQDDVLGETRGQLLRSGGLSADKFAALQLDKNFKPLTLAEMRSREPMAFKKAGL
ncbi:MAG: hypothetical protein BAX61_13275 [Psychrobacter sp. B29-1]|uniref:phage minor head protein n=1 Tax=Psychrobacter sp. B29-1 TaxID=1867800 RepID=UPI000868CA4F|nr:phage minor head protein [Psychrobacter sp. B29-1]OEH66771.1 MAG: hypothetical protein BAX61_13275 [Psychrobacter sp. B29-1]